MPSVHFLPADVVAEVPSGTFIHEAAIRAGLVTLELPCGGQGSCGQCLVELIGANGDGGRLVMACQTRVSRDLTVRVPETHELAMRVVADSHFLINEDVLPERDRLSPLCRLVRLRVPPASIEEHYSDWTRLVRELCRGNGMQVISAPLGVLRNLAHALRDEDGKVTVLVQETAAGLSVLEIEAGHTARRLFGLAVDIGTTTIAAQLVDLEDGRVLATGASYNAQIRRGADVISRIDYARDARRQKELRSLALETVNTLIGEMRRDAAVEAQDIRAAFVAGNTTMIHLLLGLPPRHIREAPYVPTVNPVPALTGEAVGFDIHPQAVVEFAPGVGSYVGGDITAGLLATELATNHDEVFLFLDIGTNGEIVIGNAEWMVGCACSAGPAFEGSGVKCGMRATSGAIEHIEIDPDGRSLRYKVIGGGKPAGICGSGLISLVGEMLKRGILDQSGRLQTGQVFLIESAERTATGEDLAITAADLENLVRTKAAIYAACARILENVGLQWSAISRVYIAGGFGRYIQVADAVLIGMLPDLAHEKFRYIGNSALTGAYIALLSRDHRRRLGEIAARMTYLDLSSDPRYMDSYIQAMFLPHTDLNQFPTVKKVISRQSSVISHQWPADD
jgi:uncharacterized 2Fe-2S/4Fe-4S cluster protein (DUF4445 family)